ncbi:hypothetical protein PPGU16_20770 [Paraburkholderia largidicola]|uniref:Uncharacterized protein n=1 Tax=Paraburkholderia largidicola TaxID=3014751 RepID=A0A7I8BLI6_9BURK|nr:hypothetical protein PPGU16_20770 [Paraburkholderia sp. PGU16]
MLNAPNAAIVGAERAAPNCTHDIDSRPSSAAMPTWRFGALDGGAVSKGSGSASVEFFMGFERVHYRQAHHIDETGVKIS